MRGMEKRVSTRGGCICRLCGVKAPHEIFLFFIINKTRVKNKIFWMFCQFRNDILDFDIWDVNQKFKINDIEK